MALVGVPIVIPSVFGILWKRPNTAGVVACVVTGVASGAVFTKALSLSWEVATIAQVGLCLVVYYVSGWIFPTSDKERRGRDELFANLGCRK